MAKSHVPSAAASVAGSVSVEHERKQVKVMQLISSYRFRGHQKAQLDPLGLMKRAQVPDLELSYHGLTEADLDTVFNTGNLRSEEHTSELQSRGHLVCRLLLEKKKQQNN